MLSLDRPEGIPKAPADLWVRRLVGSECIQFACASPAIWQFWTHWDGARRKSMPCTKPHKACAGHKLALPRRWKGYLYGVNQAARRYEFLEISLDAATKLLALVGDLVSLRGQRFKVRRGGGDAARLFFEMLPDWETYSKGELDRDKDPTATLLKLWGVEDVSDTPIVRPGVPFSD